MTSYLHPINSWRVSTGDARNGRGPDEPPPGYRWRDPRRISPERLAQLERDKPERIPPDDPRPKSAAGKPFRNAAAERLAMFGQLRHAGLTVEEAGRIVGVSDVTAWRYEHQRKDDQ